MEVDQASSKYVRAVNPKSLEIRQSFEMDQAGVAYVRVLKK